MLLYFFLPIIKVKSEIYLYTVDFLKVGNYLLKMDFNPKKKKTFSASKQCLLQEMSFIFWAKSTIFF